MLRILHNQPSSYGVGCIFCCTPINVVTEDSGPSSRWRNEFRVLYNEVRKWGSPKLSGIGDRCIDDVVPIKFGRHRREFGVHPSPELRFISFIPLDLPACPYSTATVEHAWGYFGHASCWTLFNIVCSPCEDYLGVLNALCRSSRDFYNILEIPHDYYNVIDLGLDYGPGIPVRHHRGFGHEYGEEPELDSADTRDVVRQSQRAPIYQADPLVLGLSSKMGRNLHRRKVAARINPRKLVGVQECFDKLPNELRLSILECLASADVVNLKIASAAMYCTVLGASFWKSRFDYGKEFHFVFERPSPSMGDQGWENQFETCRTLRGTSSFSNRQRIWKTLLQLKEILLGMLHRPLHGKLLRSAFAREAEAPRKLTSFASAQVWIPGHRDPFQTDPRVIHHWTSGRFELGCKALFSRSVILPVDMHGMAATLIHYNNRTFVAGLLFRSRTMGERCVGYLDPIDLKSIEFGGNRVAGFRVSFCQSGLCGISAVFITGQNSVALGVMGTLPQTQKFLPRTNTGTLVCDFDGHKMLRFGVCDARENSPEVRGRESFRRDDYLWSPEIPKSEFLLREPILPEEERSYERSNWLARQMCMFGGEQGELLPKITKLTFWLSDLFIIGIEFHHGGTSMLLGTRKHPYLIGRRLDLGPRSVSHALDGPGGERITWLRVPTTTALCCLGFQTSFGRNIIVKGHEPHYCPSGEVTYAKESSSATLIGAYLDSDLSGDLGTLGIISAVLHREYRAIGWIE